MIYFNWSLPVTVFGSLTGLMEELILQHCLYVIWVLKLWIMNHGMIPSKWNVFCLSALMDEIIQNILSIKVLGHLLFSLIEEYEE